MSYLVTALWTARTGEEEKVAAAIASLVSPTRAELGCLAYLTYRSLDDRRVFLLHEEYVDKGAYEAHAASEHFRRHALEEGIPLLESRERLFYEPLELPRRE